jgi:hypothetical protein
VVIVEESTRTRRVRLRMRHAENKSPRLGQCSGMTPDGKREHGPVIGCLVSADAANDGRGKDVVACEGEVLAIRWLIRK